MHRWFSDRLDDAMLPLLKLMTPGFSRRMEPYRAALPLTFAQVTALAQGVRVPDVALDPEPTWRGYRSVCLRFESPLDGCAAHNRTVVGRLLYAAPDAPWVLVVPGYGTGAAWPHDYSLFQDRQGWALLRRGVSVALIDLPYHRHRRKPGRTSGESFFSPDLAATQQAVLQSALDVLALLRYLRQHGGRPVGLWGTSLGGCVAGLAASHEPGLAGVALMEPLDNPGETLASLDGSREIREVLKHHGVESNQLPALFAAVSPSAYPPAVDRRRILFATADWDRVVCADYQERFWQRWGQPRRIRLTGGHILLAASRPVTTTIAETLASWLRQPLA